jgi:PhnB protein
MTDSTALTPYIVVARCAEAIDFYKQAFGAEEVFRLTEKGTGKVGHAELRILGALLMLADEFPDHGAVSPETIGGSPVRLHLAVPDVDQATARALAAGAVVKRPPTDEFYGHRSANVADPFGYTWMLSQHVEDVDPAEMQRRWDAMS